MSKLYRAKEILDNNSQAYQVLNFMAKWTERTVCGKLILSKNEVSDLLCLCNSFAQSVDDNLEAFEKTAMDKDDADSSLASDGCENSSPSIFENSVQNEAEEQAWREKADLKVGGLA